jgi:hypothetical protein
LLLRAVYENSSGTRYSNVAGPLNIVAPCNDDDHARIVSSELWAAYSALDYDRAIQIADSLDALSLPNANGWYYAMLSARNSKRFEKQLLYFDKLFADFGVTYVRTNAAHVPRREQSAELREKDAELYSIRREMILEAIAAQNQQR